MDDLSVKIDVRGPLLYRVPEVNESTVYLVMTMKIEIEKYVSERESSFG